MEKKFPDCVEAEKSYEHIVPICLVPSGLYCSKI
jgi:hypothetical protein